MDEYKSAGQAPHLPQHQAHVVSGVSMLWQSMSNILSRMHLLAGDNKPMAALGPATAAVGILPDRTDFERPCSDANCMTPNHMATHPLPERPWGWRLVKRLCLT
jgi:hypothetical protein